MAAMTSHANQEFSANFMNLSSRVKSQDEVNAVKFTMIIGFLGACVTSVYVLKFLVIIWLLVNKFD